MAKLVISDETGHHREVPLGERILIGRSPEANLMLGLDISGKPVLVVCGRKMFFVEQE